MWLLSHITIVETMDSSEIGMNPVAMTIINPQKEYWPSHRSNQRPPVLQSATLPTELWVLAGISELIVYDRIVNFVGKMRKCW